MRPPICTATQPAHCHHRSVWARESTIPDSELQKLAGSHCEFAITRFPGQTALWRGWVLRDTVLGMELQRVLTRSLLISLSCSCVMLSHVGRHILRFLTLGVLWIWIYFTHRMRQKAGKLVPCLDLKPLSMLLLTTLSLPLPHEGLW